jgi:hypothetical protein
MGLSPNPQLPAHLPAFLFSEFPQQRTVGLIIEAAPVGVGKEGHREQQPQEGHSSVEEGTSERNHPREMDINFSGASRKEVLTEGLMGDPVGQLLLPGSASLYQQRRKSTGQGVTRLSQAMCFAVGQEDHMMPV